MNRPVVNKENLVKKILLVGGLAAATIPMGAAANAADAPAAVGTAAYSCAIGSNGTEPVPTTLAVAGVPETVEAGETLSLRGNLTLTLSDASYFRSILNLATTAGIDASTLGIVAQIGETRTLLTPRSVKATESPVAQPFAVRADVEFQDFTVPQGATGDVALSLPDVGVTPRTLAGAPEKIVFTATVKTNSIFVPKTGLECWLAENATASTISRIAIEESGQPSTTSPSTGPKSESSPSGPAADVSGGAAPAASSLPVGAAPAPDVAPVDAPVDAAEAGAALQDEAQLASSGIPGATVPAGTLLPNWLLLLLATLIPGGAVALALRKKSQLASLSHRATGRRPAPTRVIVRTPKKESPTS